MPRGNKNCCKEKIKLTFRELGHAKFLFDKKLHEKEGKWLDDVIREEFFEEEKCTEFVTVLYNITYSPLTTARANPLSAYRTINPSLLACSKLVLQEKKS